MILTTLCQDSVFIPLQKTQNSITNSQTPELQNSLFYPRIDNLQLSAEDQELLFHIKQSNKKQLIHQDTSHRDIQLRNSRNAAENEENIKIKPIKQKSIYINYINE